MKIRMKNKNSSKDKYINHDLIKSVIKFVQSSKKFKYQTIKIINI